MEFKRENYIFLETFNDLDVISFIVPAFRIFLVCILYGRELVN